MERVEDIKYERAALIRIHNLSLLNQTISQVHSLVLLDKHISIQSAHARVHQLNTNANIIILVYFQIINILYLIT